MKKVLVLLMAMCLVVTCFACTTKKDKKPVQTGNGGIAQLPQIDYEEADFLINTRAGYAPEEVFCADEESNDVRDIALMQRNAAVQDYFNIYIDAVAQSNEDQITSIIDDATINPESSWDANMTFPWHSAPLIIQGHVLNWNNSERLPYTDLSASWWMNDVNKEYGIKDAIYTAAGDACISVFTNVYGLFYNRTLGENIDSEMSEKIFDMVREGNWTYDEFYKLVKNVWYEGDNPSAVGPSEDDTYGFATEPNVSSEAFSMAWDITYVENNVETGLSVENFLSDKLITTTDRLYELYYETTGTLHTSWITMRDAFMAGRVLFVPIKLSAALDDFTGMEDTYTILPFPKYDENQEGYITGTQNDFSVWSISANVPDSEYSSLIIEALNIESENILIPTYFYEALQKKTISDPDTIEMLEYLLEYVDFEMGHLLDASAGYIGNLLRYTLMGQSNDITAMYDSRKEEILSSIEEIMQKYEDFRNE